MQSHQNMVSQRFRSVLALAFVPEVALLLAVAPKAIAGEMTVPIQIQIIHVPDINNAVSTNKWVLPAQITNEPRPTRFTFTPYSNIEAIALTDAEKRHVPDRLSVEDEVRADAPKSEGKDSPIGTIRFKTE